MLKLLLGLLAALADLFRDRQLIDAGKAEQANEAVKEVERRAEQADAAGADPAPEQLERMRNRFDRSRRGQ